jgi:hypothetical protein
MILSQQCMTLDMSGANYLNKQIKKNDEYNTRGINKPPKHLF